MGLFHLSIRLAHSRTGSGTPAGLPRYLALQELRICSLSIRECKDIECSAPSLIFTSPCGEEWARGGTGYLKCHCNGNLCHMETGGRRLHTAITRLSCFISHSFLVPCAVATANHHSPFLRNCTFLSLVFTCVSLIFTRNYFEWLLFTQFITKGSFLQSFSLPLELTTSFSSLCAIPGTK